MRFTLTLILLGLVCSANAQEASVEKSTYGIQTGLAGLWIHNESRINNTIAIRGEFGYEFSGDGGLYVYSPVFTVEPRLYYNLKRRQSKNRKIINNTGSFFSVRTNLRPNMLAFSNYGRIEIAPDITFIPSWGIKNHIGKHICFEGGLGYRIRKELGDSWGYTVYDYKVDVHFRLGYSF